MGNLLPLCFSFFVYYMFHVLPSALATTALRTGTLSVPVPGLQWRFRSLQADLCLMLDRLKTGKNAYWCSLLEIYNL